MAGRKTAWDAKPGLRLVELPGLDDLDGKAGRLGVVSPNVTAAAVRVFGDGELRQFLRSELERLPRPKLIASTGSRNASIDVKAAEERGIRVAATGYRSTPTIEMTWALILASARQIVRQGHSKKALGGEEDGIETVLGQGLANGRERSRQRP